MNARITCDECGEPMTRKEQRTWNGWSFHPSCKRTAQARGAIFAHFNKLNSITETKEV